MVLVVWLCLKNEARGMPSSAVPRSYVWVGVVHSRAERWKMRSCWDTWAGVRMVQDAVSFFGLVGMSPERRFSRSMAESDSRMVEKTMFARCRFRLVIWTARTAA